MSEPSGSQGRPYASFGRRALAAAIDFPLAYLPVCLLAIPAALVRVAITSLFPGQGESQGLATEALSVAVVILGQWLYFAGTESSPHQATVGKSILGIRVTDLEGRRIDFACASKRYFAKYLSAIPAGVGFARALLVDNHQAFHDSLAGTLVMRGSASQDAVASP